MRPIILSSLVLAVACQTPVESECDTGCEDVETGEVEDVPWTPLVLGHRGSGINEQGNPFAENTLLSIQQAMVDGADGAEVDVQQTADGALILLHDELLDATTTCGGCAVSYTAEQLSGCQALNAAGDGQPIATLDEVLLAVPEAYFNIEIKSPESCLGDFANSTAYVNATAEAVVELVRVIDAQERVQVSSFDREAVRRVEEADSNLHTALIWSTGDLNSVIQDAEWAGVDTLNGHSLVVHDGVADPVREAGFGLWLWGLEIASDVTRTAQWEPGALITDHPQIMHQTLVDLGVRAPSQ